MSPLVCVVDGGDDGGRGEASNVSLRVPMLQRARRAECENRGKRKLDACASNGMPTAVHAA
jgi:hypothetical protein